MAAGREARGTFAPLKIRRRKYTVYTSDTEPVNIIGVVVT